MRVEPNHVYVIPPNKYLSLSERTLRDRPPDAPRSLRMAIDFFLRSLADDQRENAIGIILSGTGTDGTLGLKEIKAAGGMTMVQDPDTAQHDGMPRSAIATGSADYVLPAEQMADALLRYVRHAVVPSRHRTPHRRRSSPSPLLSAVQLLHAHTKLDFSGYKTGTLRRRIHRRMSLRHLERMSAYVDLLRTDPAEVVALSKDLLISVTSFFREPAAWQVLQERALRSLIATRDHARPAPRLGPRLRDRRGGVLLAIAAARGESPRPGRAVRCRCSRRTSMPTRSRPARAGLYPEGIAAQRRPGTIGALLPQGRPRAIR